MIFLEPIYTRLTSLASSLERLTIRLKNLKNRPRLSRTKEPRRAILNRDDSLRRLRTS